MQECLLYCLDSLWAAMTARMSLRQKCPVVSSASRKPVPQPRGCDPRVDAATLQSSWQIAHSCLGWKNSSLRTDIFLLHFLKRQVCLLFSSLLNDWSALKRSLHMLVCLTSVFTLVFFSDLTSVFNQDTFSLHLFCFKWHKRRDFITSPPKRDTLPLGNASRLLHLIGMGGPLARMVEGNDFCLQHENVLCELLNVDDLSHDWG